MLAASYLFTRLFGSVGFFLANSVNMGLRVWQRYVAFMQILCKYVTAKFIRILIQFFSMMLIRNVFIYCDINPFESWKLKKTVTLYFAAAFIIINLFSVSVISLIINLLNVNFAIN